MKLFLILLVLSQGYSRRLKEKPNKPKQSGDCVLQLDVSSEWPNYPPIMQDADRIPLFPQGTFSNDDRTITIQSGDIMYLSCSRSTFENFPVEFATATCIGGSQFSVVDTDNNDDLGAWVFDDLGCTDQPDSETFELGLTCGASNEGTIVDIGFRTANPIASEDDHLQSVSVCFDKSNARSIYAYHILEKENIGRDTSNDRPSFRPDSYYSFDVADSYTQDTQDQTIKDLTGIDYSDPSSDRYLARGHLSPNADPVYYSWQDSTFYYLNVAPQFQSFNGQNWVYIENGARDFIETRQIDLVVYTGTNTVLQLDDVNGNPVDIYLYPDSAGDQLPVPLYYWKVLHDPLAGSGVAFIGVNNPWISSSDIDSLKSVCSTLITSHPVIDNVYYPDDIDRGITFCCAVDDIAESFPEIASIPELQGLTLLE